MARVSRPDGGGAVWPSRSGCSEAGERNAGIAIVLSIKMRGGRTRWSRQVIADRLYGQPADAPKRERQQRNRPERAPAAGIEGFFRQARGDETGDEDALPIGIGARLIEVLQCMLIGGFGKFSLVFQLLVRAEDARQRVR